MANQRRPTIGIGVVPCTINAPIQRGGACTRVFLTWVVGLGGAIESRVIAGGCALVGADALGWLACCGAGTRARVPFHIGEPDKVACWPRPDVRGAICCFVKQMAGGKRLGEKGRVRHLHAWRYGAPPLFGCSARWRALLRGQAITAEIIR